MEKHQDMKGEREKAMNPTTGESPRYQSQSK